METVGAARAGFLLARTRAAQSGQRSVDEGLELERSGETIAPPNLPIVGKCHYKSQCIHPTPRPILG